MIKILNEMIKIDNSQSLINSIRVRQVIESRQTFYLCQYARFIQQLIQDFGINFDLNKIKNSGLNIKKLDNLVLHSPIELDEDKSLVVISQKKGYMFKIVDSKEVKQKFDETEVINKNVKIDQLVQSAIENGKKLTINRNGMSSIKIEMSNLIKESLGIYKDTKSGKLYYFYYDNNRVMGVIYDNTK